MKQTRQGITLGGGAKFWAYISPQNDTEKAVAQWRVILRHTSSDWMGEINSDAPHAILQTPGLSGDFTVDVCAVGPAMEEHTLKLLEDSPGCHYVPDIHCSENNAGMIGIVATTDGKDARYWTVSCAL